MDGVKKISRKGATTRHESSLDHRRLQKSATLNRRFVKKPGLGAANNVTKATEQGSVRVAKAVSSSLARVAKSPVRQKAALRAVSTATRRQPAEHNNLIQRRGNKKIQPSAAFLQQQKKLRASKQAAVKQTEAQRLAKIRQDAMADLKRTTIKKQTEAIEMPQEHKLMAVTKRRMAERQAMPVSVEISAQERKNAAIQQALNRMKVAENSKSDFGETKAKKMHFWQKRGFAVAAGMAVVSLCLLGYLVSLNLPDLSVRVAAMQTGISNIYPSYVPSNYRLDGLVNEDSGRVTLNFKNETGKTFTLMEEKSSWDSTAVLANYVKKNWGEDYSVAKGQGLTIYVSNSKAAWVNGGVFYVVDGEAAELNSGDLHDIAVSL